MKKMLYPLAMLLATVACTSNKPMTADAESEEIVEVPFKVAQNYFYNNVGNPATMITDAESFAKSFGMATVMGDKGKPTDIDFNKEFLIDVIFPVTTWEMEVNPIKVEAKGDTLYYSYNVSVGKKLSYSIRPISIVIIDKEYVRPEVVLVNDQNISIEQAVDRYLVEEIGRDYAKAAHCVPFYSIIDIDLSNEGDILVWGDFWVDNFDQVADTLVNISGGSHPGLMHLKKTEEGFYVKSFDQVADGTKNLSSAKQIFGDNFEEFQQVNSDEGWREQVRANRLMDYVMEHKLTAQWYKDYGRAPKRLIY